MYAYELIYCNMSYCNVILIFSLVLAKEKLFTECGLHYATINVTKKETSFVVKLAIIEFHKYNESFPI